MPLSSRTPIPHELTREEIHTLVDYYALSAWVSQEAGFDFVEIHGAHCYLPCEFISPLSNLRTDEYGGPLENRARFPLEIVAAIRERCGEEYPVMYRISGAEGAEGGFEVEDAAAVCQMLEAAGVCAISVSAGNWYALHQTIGPMFLPRGFLVPLAATIKRAVSVPVIAVGRLDDAALAEKILADGDADMIAIGRALIADPDLPRKWQEGKLDEIRPCIACNACVDLVANAKQARCAVNPEVGREDGWEIVPAATPRRVMVVGSGPAGMEAARIARLRGHDVSIWERDEELGGKLDVASRAPSKTTVLDFRDYQARILRELGVEVHTGVEVDADAIHEAAPDVVIVATGADPLVPPIPGISGPNVIDAQEILHDRVTVAPGERYAVIGGSATGCETAEWLVAAGAEVTIVEMLPIVGQGIELITRRHLLADLRGKGVSILTKAKVTMVEPNAVLYEHTEDGSHGHARRRERGNRRRLEPARLVARGAPRRARGGRPRRRRASGRLRQRDQRRSGRGPAGLTFASFRSTIRRARGAQSEQRGRANCGEGGRRRAGDDGLGHRPALHPGRRADGRRASRAASSPREGEGSSSASSRVASRRGG